MPMQSHRETETKSVIQGDGGDFNLLSDCSFQSIFVAYSSDCKCSMHATPEELQRRNWPEPSACCQGVEKEMLVTPAEVTSNFYSVLVWFRSCGMIWTMRSGQDWFVCS